MNKKLLEDIKEIYNEHSTRLPGSTEESYQLRTISKLSEAILALNKEIKSDNKNAKIN